MCVCVSPLCVCVIWWKPYAHMDVIHKHVRKTKRYFFFQHMANKRICSISQSDAITSCIIIHIKYNIPRLKMVVAESSLLQETMIIAYSTWNHDNMTHRHYTGIAQTVFLERIRCRRIDAPIIMITHNRHDPPQWLWKGWLKFLCGDAMMAYRGSYC